MNFIFVVIGIFIIRLILSFLPSFSIDMGSWLAWPVRLAQLGPGRFYSEEVWTHYTPGFLYWLWFGGIIGWVNEFLVKLPTAVADVLTGGLIWWILKKKDKKIAIASFLLYTLNPALVFNGSVWGQIDGILTLFLFLSVFFLIEKKNILLASFFWSIAFLIKPQAIALLVPLIFIAFKNFQIKEIFSGVVVATLTLFFGSLPFFPNNPIFGLPTLISKMSVDYPYTSVFAFNFWSLFGMWKPDSQLFLGISHFSWGGVLFLLVIAALLYKFSKKTDKKETVYLLFALSAFAFFLFPTRVHERYLFPMFAFLLVGAGLLKSKLLFGLYFLLSFLHLINLYHPYAYYTDNFLRSQMVLDITGPLAPFVGVAFLASFMGILFWERLPTVKLTFWQMKAVRSLQLNVPTISFLERYSTRILLGILAFALFPRLIGLWFPSTFYFDEVYHAWTSREMLRGNPAAWEWWNTPPEGFAYEWTHPPLAKLFMAGGMMILGENSVGWRLPGALLGVGVVFLVYLLGVQLFKNKTVGILAAGIFTLDGLPLVMSRVGMNDIYFLFFALAALLLFIKERYFFSSVALGLAAAAKWTTVWVIPLLFVAMLLFAQKPRFRIFWFMFIPPLVYLASYIPFFLSGHTPEQFIELQKQMWWYHTNLQATHSYQSSWWSWPLMLRPVWLFNQLSTTGGWAFGPKDSFVSNIYAMGNPFVFWVGLIAVGVTGFIGIIKRQKVLLFIVAAWGLLFLPWALSPRIMFLYHYLPALPFLSLATAWLLARQKKNVIIVCYLLFAICYLLFYPHWTGIFVPQWLDELYYWLPGWR